MKFIKKFTAILIISALVACAPSKSPVNVKGHINKDAIKPELKNIPALISEAPVLPKPKLKPKTETYTVVVNDVDVASLLFALARDAKINIDIFQSIRGKVTLNAIDQTLPQLLDRISEQVNIRYRIKDGLLVIRPDLPFFRTYKIDYVNIERHTTSKNLISTQIASAGSSASSSTSGSRGGSGSGSNSNVGNNSLTAVDSKSSNAFWNTLSSNLSKLIVIEDLGKDGAEKIDFAADSRNILVNKETGFISVNATEKQHKQVQNYIDLVLSSAKRQVLIEATIAEVSLSNEFQAGIDWSAVSDNGNTTISQSLTGANLASSPFFSATFNDGSISASVKMLETFGNVKVLSTPKVMAINNQTAILKVVDNKVYFSIGVDTATDSNSVTTKTFTTEIHTVPVGIVMQVTPYISGNDEVTLNVRPTISRIIGFVEDPNPELAKEGVISKVPEIQVREVESILKVNSGDVAVIGGLMQDTVDESDTSVPLLAAIPIIGQLFNYSSDSHRKTELVIFIRPKVIKRADINADLAGFKSHLPQFNDEAEKAE
jgi:MSHA biogenesis protein MshL